MKIRFSKYSLYLCVLIFGFLSSITANKTSDGNANLTIDYSNENGISGSENQLYFTSGLTSSSSEKHLTNKIEVTDELEEEENRSTLFNQQLKDHDSLSLFSRFYKTGYFFHLIKNQCTFYKPITYLSSYKTLHLMFSVLQL
ncbi:hypothetical protein N9Y48_01225 [Zobellia sp.]|nr:hypothetical protein [Zobellia sp.]